MSSVKALQTQIQQSGLVDVPAASRDDALEAARSGGLADFIVDCDRARSQSAVLRAIVKAVDFPDFFGNNLDALYDCLTDTVMEHADGVYLWFYRLHTGDPYLGQYTPAILAVCDDAVEFARNNDRVFSYTIEHAGKHPDPEEQNPDESTGDDA